MDVEDDDREHEQEWLEDHPEDPPGTHPAVVDPIDGPSHVPPRHSGRRGPHERKRRSYRPPSELDRD